MKQKPDLEKKLESALESLQGIQRAQPLPYFYTRLRARMERGKEWGAVAGLISRPAYAIAMICAVLFINTWIVIRNDKTPAASATRISVSEMPEEYNLAVNTFYDYETP